MFYKARRIKLDHGYILTMFYASSNLCNNLHSFCSNLCVYYIIVVTICMYINYYFVSTYIYKCIIILFIIIYLLYVGQLMCSTCFFCDNFFYMCEKNLFLYIAILFVMFSDNWFYFCDNLRIWPILFLWQLIYINRILFFYETWYK